MDLIQRSFTTGEIAPSVRARTDLAKNAAALALCENFFVRAQGGVYSRQGLRFIGEVGQHVRRGRLIPFQFNTTQTYMLLFENLTMRVIKDGGFVEVSGSPYELATPYTEAQLSRLSFTQDADVMTIVHPDHDSRDLSRIDHDDWSLDVIDFTPPILPPVWATGVTASISAVTQATVAEVTTTAPHGLSSFDPVTITGVVGMTQLNNNVYNIAVTATNKFILIDINSTGFTAYSSGGTVTKAALTAVGSGGGSFNKTYDYVVTTVDVNGVESVAGIERSITLASLSATYGVRLEWDAVTGADYYRVYKNPSNDTEVYGWIGDSKTTQFDDFNIGPDTSDSPPEARDPVTGVNNRASTVGYYQQRRLFANTYNNPQTVYGTQTGIYNSMRTSFPARDTDAITFTLKARQVNEIRHIIAIESLILLTSGAEWRITEGQDQVLTPATVGAKIQSYDGASWVTPVVVGDSILYVQEKGTKIRNISYEFSQDKFAGSDLSILAEHLFEDHTIEEMTFSYEPYGIAWMVRDDGVLLGLTYQRQQQVWAWHQHTTDGEFESVATISEDGRDATYVIVKRTINGSTKRYVERFEKRVVSAPEDVFCVDSGLSYSGAPTTTFSGLDHLIGESVVAVADGIVVEGLTVSAAGSVTLPRAASKVSVGLPYTCVIETLDIDTPGSRDYSTFKSRETHVSRVILEVENSRGGWAGPKLQDGSTGEMLEIKPRFDSDGYGAIALKSFKQEIRISPEWGKGGGIRIEQRAPMPMAILSVIPNVDIS